MTEQQPDYEAIYRRKLADLREEAAEAREAADTSNFAYLRVKNDRKVPGPKKAEVFREMCVANARADALGSAVLTLEVGLKEAGVDET